MPRADIPQLNIRSRFARDRAFMIAGQTGRTVTQVIEEALRVYQPSSAEPPPGDLIRKAAILVKPAKGKRISSSRAQAALDEDRAERGR